MEHGGGGAALTIAVALAAGMIATAIARHVRLPGIVLLIAAGVLLGPDVLDVVHPDAVGNGLQMLVGFAVAVILFEGGLNLNLRRLREQATVIRRLLLIGSLVTALGATLAARWIMDWDWRIAVPFGTLVVVTGPTVINPLLRRIRVATSVETVLEAEGVLIDAIGAVLAVVTLEAVLSFSAESVAGGLGAVFVRLGFGALAGLVAGFGIAGLLRYRFLVPEGLENTLTLTLVMAVFQASNALLPESGIMTVTAAGMVVGNINSRKLRDLMDFKEQLTVMFIGLLFVLLAADVRIDDVLALGWPGVLTVVTLMLVVRPLNVTLSTWGSNLNLRERAFLSWLAPRGVVAAAVASLFAQSLAEAGIPGGNDLRALVFMVIAGTVVVQGLTGGVVAQLLGLRRVVKRGFVILGANEIGRELGRLLAEADLSITLIDNNPYSVRAAQEAGLRVVYGSAIDERTLVRAGMDERKASIAVVPNEEVNLLFADRAHDEYRHAVTYVALRHTQTSVRPEAARATGARVLFGRPRDLEMWMVRLRRDLTRTERWTLRTPPDGEERPDPFDMPEQLVVPLVLYRGGSVNPVADDRPFKKGDTVAMLLFAEKLELARDWLRRQGFEPEPTPEGADAPDGTGDDGSG